MSFITDVTKVVSHKHPYTIHCRYLTYYGDHGGTMVKVLCYKLEGRWFDPSWCQWIFH